MKEIKGIDDIERERKFREREEFKERVEEEFKPFFEEVDEKIEKVKKKFSFFKWIGIFIFLLFFITSILGCVFLIKFFITGIF